MKSALCTYVKLATKSFPWNNLEKIEWKVIEDLLKIEGLRYFTLSSPKVLVSTNPHPCSKALRHIAPVVVGGAEASPKGFSNFSPQTSTEMSTCSSKN